MADNPIATVYVTILPETSRVAADIKKALREVDPEAREAGKRWGKEIKDAIGPIKPEVKPETVSAKAELEKFRREEERKKIRQKIEFDEGDFRRKMELLGKEFEGVGGKLASAGKFNLGLAGIGLIAPAATALANLAGTVQQLAGAGLVLPGVFAGMASSMGTAALGAHGMKDALDAISKASDGTQASVDAANKALAELSPNAAETVKTVSGLKGTFDDLVRLDSQNLFAGVSEGLRGLVGNLLPATTRGVDGISRALNQNLLQAMNSLGSGSSQGFLSRIFGNTATAQGQLTSAIDPIVHAMGTLTAAGSDALPRLATAIGKVAERFDHFITAADRDGRLSKWINDGLTGFTQLGNIALNLGKSFTAITQAAGGGDGLLPMLQNATERLQLFLNSSDGQRKLIDFFNEGRNLLGQLKDVAVEAGPVLSGMFQAGINAASIWLPVIREILSTINGIPGGAAAVVQAFVAWKTITAVSSVASSLTNVLNLLKGVGPAAATAGAEGAAGLSPLITKLGIVAGAIAALPNIQNLENRNIPGASFFNNLPTPDNLIGDASRAAQGQPTNIFGPRTTTAAGQAQAARDAAVRAARDNAGKPGLFGNGATGGTSGPPPSSLFGGGLTAAPPPPPVVIAPVTQVPVPAVSSYAAPVVTEPPKGAGGSTTPNLPYTGTADPYAGTSAVAAAYPGESARAFAHRVEEPRFEAQGLTVGDHAADKYGEHQNGALDIMVSSLTEGANVLQQVLSDPNLYGAIFNNQTYGYGHGLTPRDYSAGHTGDPSQDHTNHVHAFFKPGGSNNITPLAGGAPPYSSAVGPVGTDYGSPGLTSQDMSVRNAQQRVNDTQHSQEQAEARLNELRAKGTATDRQLEAAEYAVAKAKREHTDAIDSLAIAQDKYNKSASTVKKGKGGMNSDAESLGASFLGGIAQIFGLDGSVFADPTQFGLFQIAKSAMGLKFDPSQAAPGMGQTVAPSGGDFLGGILSNVPQPFGQPQIGSADSPGPGNNAGGPGGMDFRGATFGINPQQWTEQIAGLQSSNNRYQPMLNNLPQP